MPNTRNLQTWSFSSLKQYEKCPYSQYLKRIQRIATEENTDETHPLVRGNRIHREAEEYVKGEVPDMPRSIKRFTSQFESLQDLYKEGQVILEEGMGFTSDWEPCGFTDWGSVWHQSKMDAVIKHDETTFTIIDYKTGKSWGNEVPHSQQGALYGVALMCLFPQAQSITVEFWYLDEGKTKRRTYNRSQLTAQMANFNKRAVQMTSATEFPPKPNKMNCLYCDYGVANGNGKCQYAVDPDL